MTLSASSQAQNETKTFQSSNARVNLLELYTSEGCSSCPPADAWVAKLVDHPKLWEEIIPIVFHVDYWNYLGWPDPFSKAQHSKRQRNYKAQGRARSVYTPGFFLNGNEWRGWFSGDSPPLENEKVGILTAELIDGEIHASFEIERSYREGLLLQVAVLGFDLITQVPAGENRGKDLTHQFTVLAQASAKTTNKKWRLKLPEAQHTADKLGLAVWISRIEDQAPIQATGGWLN